MLLLFQASYQAMPERPSALKSWAILKWMNPVGQPLLRVTVRRVGEAREPARPPAGGSAGFKAPCRGSGPPWRGPRGACRRSPVGGPPSRRGRRR